MEPTVLAALIAAGSKLTVSVFERWSGHTSDSKISPFVSEHYETYRQLCSDKCMRLLRRMEDGQYHSFVDLLGELYPKLDSGQSDLLHHEFEYRLMFLALAGLIVQSEQKGAYYLTKAGKAFVTLARQRMDYFNVFRERPST
jgi:hypothetical protein